MKVKIEGLNATAVIEEINDIGPFNVKMLKGERGDQGLTVESAEINGSGHLIIWLNDGTDIDAGNVANDVFWATYGSTAYADITAARAAGKIPVCFYGTLLCVLRDETSGPLHFIGWQSETSQVTLTVTTEGVWSHSTANLENTANRVTSVSASSTDSQYPTAKAVYDNAVEIFWCYYPNGSAGRTDGAEITAAVAAGKLPVLKVTHTPAQLNETIYASYCGTYSQGGIIVHMFMTTHGGKLWRFFTPTTAGGAWIRNSTLLDTVSIYSATKNGSVYDLDNGATVSDIYSVSGRIVMVKIDGFRFELRDVSFDQENQTYSMTFEAVDHVSENGTEYLKYQWITLENVAGSTASLPEPEVRLIDLDAENKTVVYTASYANSVYTLDNGATLDDIYTDYNNGKLVYLILGGLRYQIETCAVAGNTLTIKFGFIEHSYALGPGKYQLTYHMIDINGADGDSSTIPAPFYHYVFLS